MKETREEKLNRLKKELDALDYPHEEVKSIITNALHNFTGNLNVLEGAIGCMFLTMMLGRRVMLIVHSPKTIAKYEKILGVKFRDLDFIQEETMNSERSYGYKIASQGRKFWDFVRGQEPLDNRDKVGIDTTY